MPINIANKPQLMGIILLSIGVALLAFTFINAFLFLQEPFSILATGDLARVFGEALAPLIQACIRLMYLGIMGWIGSMLTVRGIPLVTHKHVLLEPAHTPAPTQTAPTPQQQLQPQPQSQVTTQPKATAAAPGQPKQAPQQPKTETPQQVQPLKTQNTHPTPQPEQEEPKAILIPPENQREE
jgi:outer membrane biosynthesis protein TonB